MQISVFQFVSASQNDVAEELLEKLSGFVYVFLKIAVIGTYQCISEIPGIVFKRLVVDIYTKRLQIFDNEYSLMKSCLSSSL